MSVWKRVTSRQTGKNYFARVSRESHHSDDAYSRWTVPEEYEVCEAKSSGYVLEPDPEHRLGRYTTREFYALFERKAGEPR